MHYTKSTQGKETENRSQIEAREKNSLSKTENLFKHQFLITFKGNLKKSRLKPTLIFAPFISSA